MTFQCEDLPDFGLVLVPPSSPDYEPLFADIQRRIESPLEKRETSAILLNDSGKSIAAIDAVWRYEDIAGHTFKRRQNNNRRPFAVAIFHPGSAPKDDGLPDRNTGRLQAIPRRKGNGWG